MINWDSYKHEEAKKPSPKTGKRRCVIISADEKTSKKSGSPMIEIVVRPSGSRVDVKTWIVQNEYFNQKMSRFYEAFNEIPEGNHEYLEWVGAKGGADFGLDDRGYLKVKWFLSRDEIDALPPFEGDAPVKQEFTELPSDDSEDELPFMFN